MKNKPRVISIEFPFFSGDVSHDELGGDKALFDFDVVVIRPMEFHGSLTQDSEAVYQYLASVMLRRKRELNTLFVQGGVLVIFLDVPSYYSFQKRGYGKFTVGNYDFLDGNFTSCVQRGTGTQITFKSAAEPFVKVLKNSTVAWTSYLVGKPARPMDALQVFAMAGAAGTLAGKMPYGEGHIIILPNVSHLDESSFFDACAEYRFKRQGSTAPEWVGRVFVPGLDPIQTAISELDKQISDLQNARQFRSIELEERSAYRKLLYEKGKTQLEPIVLRALDDLGFGSTPGEIIASIHEIDGRTREGPGIVEVKGSKNQIAQSEFSPFVTKILADAEASKVYSKGILVGNGLCETEPGKRMGDSVFSPHVLTGAKLNSVALVNSVELYWLCCALLRGDAVDKKTVRDAILTGNGYVDLKPFSGQSPFSDDDKSEKC